MRDTKKEVTKYSVALTILVAVLLIPFTSKAQSALQVSCSPNAYSTTVNNQVGWSAYATGGNGSYLYFWSGTDGTSGNVNSTFNTYATQGTKTATVSVTSGGQSATINCGSVYVYPNYANNSIYNYGMLDGSCLANTGSTQVGNNVNWSGTASGGNGIYNYYWSDSDGYTSSSGSGQFLSKYYTFPGLKNMTLTITSAGQSIARLCSVYITPIAAGTNYSNNVYSGYPVYTNQNQILSYNNSNPNISSVYLSSVPSTGLEDVTKPVIFAITLILLSAMLAYMFLKKRSVSNALLAKKVFSNSEKTIEGISEDEEGLRRIEDYAEKCKVLLSSEATVSLLKFERQGKVNALDIIKKMSRGDWIAVGGKDLEDYLQVYEQE